MLRSPDRWAPCPESSWSYVRNELPSLWAPALPPALPGGQWSRSGRLSSPLGWLCLCFLCWHQPLSCWGPAWCLSRGHCRPGEQVASGSGQRLSPAAGRPELEVGTVGNSIFGGSCSFKGPSPLGMSPL